MDTQTPIETKIQMNIYKITKSSILVSISYFLGFTYSLLGIIGIGIDSLPYVIALIYANIIILLIGLVILSLGLLELGNFFQGKNKTMFKISYSLIITYIAGTIFVNVFGIIWEFIPNLGSILSLAVDIILLICYFGLMVVLICVFLSLSLLLNNLKAIQGMNSRLLITPFISIPIIILRILSPITLFIFDDKIFWTLYLASDVAYSLIMMAVCIELIIVFKRINVEQFAYSFIPSQVVGDFKELVEY